MKRITLLFVAILLAVTGIMAQTPNQFKYQAVLRDAGGVIMANEAVTVDISILQGSASGTSVFDETHNVTTTAQGLINLNIGSVSDLSVVDFSADIYFIEISVNGTVMGASQLLSVPYALQAKTAENVFSGNFNDLTNQPTLTDVLNEGNDAGNNNIVNVGTLGIGTTTPNSGAALEINSTTGALLLPRLTNAQQNALNASEGMIIYNTEDNIFRGYKIGDVLDQQQNTHTTTSGGIGQSFTAGTTGLLTAIEINGAGGSGILTLNIYDGEGMTGTLLHSETVNLSGMGYLKFTLTTPVSVTAGQVYTFDFDGPGYAAWYDNTDPYSGGKGYINNVPGATMDWEFNTYIDNSGWVDIK